MFIVRHIQPLGVLYIRAEAPKRMDVPKRVKLRPAEIRLDQKRREKNRRRSPTFEEKCAAMRERMRG